MYRLYRNYSVLLLVTLLSVNSARAMSPSANDFKVMTFNLRYAWAFDWLNSWIFRKKSMGHFLREEMPDVVFFQESMLTQTHFLQNTLPEYDSIWRGRKVDPESDEACPVFYKKDRFQFESGGTFWLSATPEIPGSKTWGNSIPRIATWARLFDMKSTKTILFVNTHFDYEENSSQIEAAKLILHFVGDHPADAVIFGGDFNVPETHEAIRFITSHLVDTWRLVHPTDRTGTWHDWTGRTDDMRIDFLLTSPHTLEVKNSKIYTEKYEGRLLSDHFAVATEFDWNHEIQKRF